MKKLLFLPLIFLLSCTIDKREHYCEEGDYLDSENSDGVTEYITIEDIHGNIYEIHPSLTTKIKAVNCK